MTVTPDCTDQPWARKRGRGRPRIEAGDKTCCRCGRAMRHAAARMPDGRLCGLCFEEAAATYGTCPGCHSHRLLPGLDVGTGARLCCDCAGVTRNFRCETCGTEALIYRNGNCRRCALRVQLTELLHPEDHPGGQALLEEFTKVERPASIITWLRNPRATGLLRSLGSGATAYSHEAFDELPRSKTVEHVRAVLVQAGVLTARDPHFPGFLRWLDVKLTAISDDGRRRTIRQFAQWKFVVAIRTLVDGEQPTHAAIAHARQSITVADQFLTWLAEQQQSLALATQLDLDRWLATGPSTRTRVHPFIVWAVQSRNAHGLTMPTTKSSDGPEMDHQQRLEWIRRCLTNTDIPREERVATLLLLLYAQPITRIAALPVSAIEVDDSGNTFLRFHRVRSPVPEPFATLLLDHRDQRSPTQTTSGVESPWLFPGYRAGQHLTAHGMMIRIRKNGLDLRAAHNAALRTLVREAPAPLVAKSLGYADTTIHRHAAIAASQFQHYAASRPSRTSN